MILGNIVGKTSTIDFKFLVKGKAKKFQFVQIQHPEYGFVLGQVIELERKSEETMAYCNVIGYKDEGKIKQIRTPLAPGTEVLVAEDDFIREMIQLEGKEGAYIGFLEGKDIKVYLDLEKLLTKHVSVLAKTGAGKSYFTGILVEEILEKGIPLLIIDPHGEYSQIKMVNEDKKDNERMAVFGVEPRGYLEEVQEYGNQEVDPSLRPITLDNNLSNKELLHLLPTDLTSSQEGVLYAAVHELDKINLNSLVLSLQELESPIKWNIIPVVERLLDSGFFSEDGFDYNELIKPGKCSIINLKGVAPEFQEIIVYKLMKDLFKKRKLGEVPPFFAVIEEAHNYCPERNFGKAKSAPILRTIASEGRKFGLGLCVISQRPALVEKNILSQCNTQVILKITNPNDLKAVSSSIEGITSQAEGEIRNLSVGTAMVCGLTEMPLVVNVRPRKSQHGGRAVNILSSGREREDKAMEEAEGFRNREMERVIKPKLSIKDLYVMSTKEIKEIKTYLIPAVFFVCEVAGEKFNLLVDQLKGKVIVDPDKKDFRNIGDVVKNPGRFSIARKPEYVQIDFDKKLDKKVGLEELKRKIGFEIKEAKECFVVYYKVDYEEA